MAYLNTDNDVAPMRMEMYCGEPRYWMDGKPESGIFTWQELREAYTDDDELRKVINSGKIIFDVSSRGA